ncbi:MAG: class I SAM-dependent methyltransferase, partial [Candidatus Bathyarchaeia archaeon]
MDIGFECAASMPSVSREVEVGLRHKQRLLSGLPVSRLLDVGCNNGTISLLYARFCGAAEVYGVDVDHRLVSEAKKRGVKAFTCDLNLDKIPFGDNFFELVTATEVLEHLYDTDHALAEIHLVLRLNGYLLE